MINLFKKLFGVKEKKQKENLIDINSTNITSSEQMIRNKRRTSKKDYE